MCVVRLAQSTNTKTTRVGYLIQSQKYKNATNFEKNIIGDYFMRHVQLADIEKAIEKLEDSLSKFETYFDYDKKNLRENFITIRVEYNFLTNKKRSLIEKIEKMEKLKYDDAESCLTFTKRHFNKSRNTMFNEKVRELRKRFKKVEDFFKKADAEVSKEFLLTIRTENYFPNRFINFTIHERPNSSEQNASVIKFGPFDDGKKRCSKHNLDKPEDGLNKDRQQEQDRNDDLFDDIRHVYNQHNFDKPKDYQHAILQIPSAPTDSEENLQVNINSATVANSYIRPQPTANCSSSSMQYEFSILAGLEPTKKFKATNPLQNNRPNTNIPLSVLLDGEGDPTHLETATTSRGRQRSPQLVEEFNIFQGLLYN